MTFGSKRIQSLPRREGVVSGVRSTASAMSGLSLNSALPGSDAANRIEPRRSSDAVADLRGGDAPEPVRDLRNRNRDAVVSSAALRHGSPFESVPERRLRQASRQS